MQASNLKLVSVQTVEQKLRQMRTLKDQINELTAHYEMLKDEVIIEHFSSCVEYRTAHGLLLATYKEVVSSRFQQKEFEAAYPELGEQFKKPTSAMRFELK